MYVKELWRYPVKSLAGERLEQARISELGIEGDRVVLAVGRTGRIVTSRSHPHLLGLKGTLGDDGQPRINGLKWDDPAALELVQAAAGPNVRLVRYDGPERFDILPLSIATDGAIAHMGFDGRRLRPNWSSAASTT